VDVLTDCPSRERAGWLCDSYFTGKAEQLMTGFNRVEHNFLQSYLFAPPLPQLPKGMLPMCYPSDHFNGEYIPNWAMFFIIEIEDYLLRAGDRAFIDRCKDKVLSLIEFFERYKNKDGLLERLDSWIFVEWSKAADFVRDINFPTNMLYYKTLKSAAALYGREDLNRRAGEIKDAVRALSYNGEFFEDNLVYENGELTKTGNITETCQYYAFYFGIADKETYPRLYDTMFTVFGPERDDGKVFPTVYRSNAFIGNFLRLDYLKREGGIKQAYDECFDYFGRMAQRTGTLWENDKPHASCNHGFASYAAAFFLEAVAGYKGFDPASKTVYLCKPAVPLDFEARFPLRGEILSAESKNGRYKMALPEGWACKEKAT
jgi:alpha-L-rhamnosidase